MWLFLIATALACAHGQFVKTGHAGTKGGYGSNWQYGENQMGYGQQPYNPPLSEVGVCYIEVPTATLVRDPTHVPTGNGSRPDLSRIHSCCEGYIRNIHNRMLCDPVCNEECINGLCTAPNTCTCYPDHVKNVAGFCIATCPIGCQNGNCAGGECVCKNGYRLDSQRKYCLPMCRDNCNGIGNCTAPNTCTCNPGYQSTPDGSCQASCNKPCENGYCVSNSECRCKPGYDKDYRGSCVPKCSPVCGTSETCIAPNTCVKTTTVTPGSYPYQPNNPNNPTYNQQYPNNNPQFNYSSSHPHSPDNLRPQYTPNGPNSYYPGQQHYYPGMNNTYYPGDNQRPYNISSDSQIKPSYPNNDIYGTSHSYGQMNSSGSSSSSSYNQTGIYNSGPNPYNPSNPNQRPTNGQYYPYIPDSSSIGGPTNPNQPGYYPGTSGQPYQPYYPGMPNQPGQAGYYPGQQQPGYPYTQNSSHPNKPSYNPVPSLYPALPGQPNYNPNQPPYGQPNQSNLSPYQPNGPGQSNMYQPGQIYPNQPGNYPGQNPQNSSYSNQPGYYPGQPNSYQPHQPYNPNPYDRDSSESGEYSGEGVPQCSQPCLNGICVGLNRCQCNTGYVLDTTDASRSKCIPHCPGGCMNGVCSAPNFCICNMGYRKEQGVKGRSGCVRRMK